MNVSVAQFLPLQVLQCFISVQYSFSSICITQY